MDNFTANIKVRMSQILQKQQSINTRYSGWQITVP